MNKKWLSVSGLMLTLATASTAGAAASARERLPNVVVIIADDLGYGDVQCYNPERGKIPTPRIDRLASQGMSFTDAHSSSGVCSPSRYTLLTGRYHWRTRLQRGIVGQWQPPLIAAGRLTIADLARRHGYRTACIGKWHLGWEWGIARDQQPHFRDLRGKEVTEAQRAAWREVFSLPIGGGPLAAGFDYYFGTDVPNWPPFCFIENDRTVGVPSELLPAALTAPLQGSQGPALPGWSFEPILPELVGRACTFIADAVTSPEPFLLYLPLTTPHTPLAVNEAWRGSSKLDSPVADLIVETDAAVGQVLDALDEAGVADNTIVLFTSDNGFASYTGAPHLEERGHFPSGPLRGYKGDAWEGGHRVPFIVRWPGTVPPASVSHQLVHHADLMATFAEVLGASLPADAGEDSFSLMPVLRDPQHKVRDHAVSQSSKGVFAVRQGPWKLIIGPGGGGSWSGDQPSADDPPRQLYQLDADLGETRNLFYAEPERAASLDQLLDTLIRNGRSTPGPRLENDVMVKRPAAVAAPDRRSR